MAALSTPCGDHGPREACFGPECPRGQTACAHQGIGDGERESRDPGSDEMGFSSELLGCKARSKKLGWCEQEERRGGWKWGGMEVGGRPWPRAGGAKVAFLHLSATLPLASPFSAQASPNSVLLGLLALLPRPKHLLSTLHVCVSTHSLPLSLSLTPPFPHLSLSSQPWDSEVWSDGVWAGWLGTMTKWLWSTSDAAAVAGQAGYSTSFWGADVRDSCVYHFLPWESLHPNSQLDSTLLWSSGYPGPSRWCSVPRPIGKISFTIQFPLWPQLMPRASQLCACASESELWTRERLLWTVKANR